MKIITIIAFLCITFPALATPNKLTFERDSTILIANLDGSNPIKIASGQSPDFSPDRTKLGFNTVQKVGQPAHCQIAVVDLTTGKTKVLKTFRAITAWNPIGHQMVNDFF